MLEVLAQGLGGQADGAQAHVADHDAHIERDTGVEQLPEAGAVIIALPLKIEGGSGSPARVVALVAR